MSNDIPKILVVDDDHSFLQVMGTTFGKVFSMNLLDSTAKAKERNEFSYDLVLVDLVFEDEIEEKSTEETEFILDAGLGLIRFFKKHKPNIPIIAVTKYGGDQNLLKAIKAGADDFLRKEEFDPQEWISRIRKLIRLSKVSIPKNDEKRGAKFSKKPLQIQEKETDTKQSRPKEHEFIGNSPKILFIKEELIALSAEPEITVLLLGETGVGKEVAAKYLYKNGARRDQPFKAVNLSSYSETLLASTLFGHRKGAFTDAKEDSIGAFGEANGGVLFLDEIGEISETIQIKLLRFLEDKIITPVGGKEKFLDVQIVAATNKNLKAEVQTGKFRSDLFQRLNSFPIDIPPLRDRREDIKPIIKYYLEQKGEKLTSLENVVWQRLYQYHWPGNVRELVNLLQRLLLKKRIAKKDRVLEIFLPDEIRYPNTSDEILGSVQDTTRSVQKDKLALQTASQELRTIEDSLLKHGKKQLVCKELGLKNLDALRYKINRHYEDFPYIFDQFPTIRHKYKLN